MQDNITAKEPIRTIERRFIRPSLTTKRTFGALTLKMKPAVALICLIGLSGAGQAPAFELTGLYLFHTTAQRQDLVPVCSELWEFTTRGELLISSGEERAEHGFRIQSDRDGIWLVSHPVKSNGAPDCMGHRNPIPSPEERRTYLVPMNDGRVATCPAPTRTESGAPFISGCYGFMVPADQAG